MFGYGARVGVAEGVHDPLHARALYVEAGDEALLVEDTIEYPIQVNGKLRGRLTVSVDAEPADIESQALADDAVKRAIGDKAVRKVIVVKGKMINVVAN